MNKPSLRARLYAAYFTLALGASLLAAVVGLAVSWWSAIREGGAFGLVVGGFRSLQVACMCFVVTGAGFLLLALALIMTVELVATLLGLDPPGDPPA